jgi:hypothetical protein
MQDDAVRLWGHGCNPLLGYPVAAMRDEARAREARYEGLSVLVISSRRREGDLRDRQVTP